MVEQNCIPAHLAIFFSGPSITYHRKKFAKKSMSQDSEELVYINEQQPAQDQAENDFRVLVLVQKDISTAEGSNTDITVEESEAKGKILEGITSFTGINKFFDAFDEQIAYPNQGNLKYDVGSDGFIVIIVGSNNLKENVLNFIDEYLAKAKKPLE